VGVDPSTAIGSSQLATRRLEPIEQSRPAPSILGRRASRIHETVLLAVEDRHARNPALVC
jgi:hypothetical protein